ncbi:MAG: hypothetical protein WD651_01270, partial [Acidimicrobiia bacterium]
RFLFSSQARGFDPTRSYLVCYMTPWDQHCRFFNQKQSLALESWRSGTSVTAGAATRWRSSRSVSFSTELGADGIRWWLQQSQPGGMEDA